MNTRKNWLRNTAIATVGVLAFFPFQKRTKPRKTVKMLTEDGQLVEIYQDKLPSTNNKASNKDLQTWVKRHQP